MPELTYKYRLYPTDKQALEIRRTCSCVRLLYNSLLEDRTKHFRETGKWKKMDRSSYEALPFMANVDPGALNWAVASLQQAYRNFFHTLKTKTDRYRPESEAKSLADPKYVLKDTDLVSYPRPKRHKTSKESYTTYIEDLKIENNRVLLPSIGAVKIRLHRPIPPEAEQLCCTVLKEACGHYYLLLRLKLPDAEEKKDLETPMGIVFAQGKLAVRSDGEPVMFRHQDEKSLQRIRQARKALLRRTPGSRGYEEARLQLAKLYKHRSNQRHNDLHAISRQIIDAADTFYLQKPDIMERLEHMESWKARQRLLDEAWWTFGEMVRYKAEAEGKRFWSVPRGFPAYSLCSACDHRVQDVPDGKWVCPACGAELAPEINAARNLMKLGEKYIQEMKEIG